MAHDARLRPRKRGRNGEGQSSRSGKGEPSAITSLTGSTPGGMPLALNRAPRDSLRPWITRIGVTDVTLQPGQRIECRTFNEHPVLRIIFGARWSARTADGGFDYDPGEAGMALYFGPNSRHMPLVAHGGFRVVTINCGPGAGGSFDLPPPPETVDRIYRLDPVAGAAKVLPGYRPQSDKRAWLDAAEDQLAAAVAGAAPPPPAALMTAFETLCLTDPGGSLDGFVGAHAVTRRTLERAIHREWGVTPHQAQRRARALDMAAVLLGVALEEEEQELRLRYFDQSHLIREMRHYFDMTPGQLQHEPHPLLRITMEIRQSRRIEALARIGAGDPRPWRDPRAEPKG
jgi:AraC-like DNA-binding protein